MADITGNTSITPLANLSFCKKIIDAIIGPDVNIADDLTLEQEDQIKALNKKQFYLTFGREYAWDTYVTDEYTVTSTLAQVLEQNTTVTLVSNANTEISVGDVLAFKNSGLPSVYIPGANVLSIASGGLSLVLNSAPEFTIANATIIRTRDYYTDNNAPPVPGSIDYGTKKIWDSMIGGKSVTGNDLCIVVKRWDWTANTVYAKYDPNDATLYDKAFYVLNNNTNSVYKCLDNANDSPSTEEPSFIPTNDWTTPVYTSDGYVWKYMFTLSNMDVIKFLSDNYMPVRHLDTFSNQPLDQWNVQEAAVQGTIENIIVLNSGSGYVIPSDGSLAVALVGGGGTGATAVVESVDGGTIPGIIVLTSGEGYGSNVTRTFTTTANSSTLTHSEASIPNTYIGSIVFGDIIPLDAYVTDIDNASSPKRVYISANANTSSTNTCVILGTPRVEITGGGGTNAAATAVVTANVVSSVVVDNIGQDYITPIIIDITGDGSGAELSIDRSQIGLNGEILGVNVDVSGNGYSNVVVTISGGGGNNAILKAFGGPPGGHGSNPEQELGGQAVMFAVNLDGTEHGLILSLDSEYRQVALVENPISANTDEIMTDSTFFQPVQVLVSPGINNFATGEFVYQGNSLEEATFKGIVQLFDTANNVLFLTNTFYKDGLSEPTLNPIIGNTTGAHREYVSQMVSPVKKYTGSVIFIQNFVPVERSYNQTEAVRIVFNQ